MINRTLLVLILKIQGPEVISQFCPISLCTVMYNIITKIIVNRLRPVMSSIVRLNQTSFVAGRNISDNIIIAQEAIHTMKSMKGKTYKMSLKVDLEKPYDKVH